MNQYRKSQTKTILRQIWTNWKWSKYHYCYEEYQWKCIVIKVARSLMIHIIKIFSLKIVKTAYCRPAWHVNEIVGCLAFSRSNTSTCSNISHSWTSVKFCVLTWLKKCGFSTNSSSVFSFKLLIVIERSFFCSVNWKYYNLTYYVSLVRINFTWTSTWINVKNN